MFIALYAEISDKELAVEPYISTIGMEHVKLLYKYIWIKMKHPEIEDFGKRFFFELCDTNFQIQLVKSYMEATVS